MSKSNQQTPVRSSRHKVLETRTGESATVSAVLRVDGKHGHAVEPISTKKSVWKLEAEGVLDRNRKPGYRAESACLPNVVCLSDKELLCFYRLGQAFYSHDGRIAQLRSTDGGLTWRKEPPLWDPKNDSYPYSYTAPHGTLLRDGTLLVVASRFDVSDPDQEMFNPQTGGVCLTEKVLFRSVDRGRTWSEPRRLDLPGEGLIDLPSQVIELNDGRLFLACETWKGWDDTRPLHLQGFAVFSDDGGNTWSDRLDFPSASDSAKMYSHTRYTRMLDGRILGLQWTQNIGGNVNYDLHLVLSDESGRNWTLPVSTGIQAQTSWAADVGNGWLTLAYTRRGGANPGVFMVLSEDGGRSWDIENQIQVWDAVGQEFLGVEQIPEYPRSHDNVAFGKPNLTRLPDGSFLCSWWCTQMCITHSRFAKLRALGANT